MADSDFQELVERERARLTQARQDALSRRAAIDKEINQIDDELGAIAAYDAARRQKASRNTVRTAQNRGLRVQLLNLVSENSEGMTRGEILEKVGLKGNKSREQSVSNALNALKAAGKLTQKDGRYRAA